MRWESEPDKRQAAKLIAAAFLGGSLDAGVEARVASVCNASTMAVRGLVTRLIAHFGTKGRPREFRVRRFVWEDRGFQRFSSKQGFECPTNVCPEEAYWPREMLPAAGAPRSWKVLPITTVGELAERLNLNAKELGWFADGRLLERKVGEERLRHYRYRWIAKRDGSARLVEAPKQKLRAIQRFLLEKVLNAIPPHEAVHGFRTGRSIKTFTDPHVGRQVVLKVDLRNFFPSVTAARVRAVFLTAGYPESVAEVLTGLCTNGVPAAVIDQAPTKKRYYFRQMYGQPHLPQGAPTSPALANLCAFRLDCRLTGLAEAAGGTYTRYADDLLFSGDTKFARAVTRFYIKVCAITLEEGFEVNTRKTRIMRQSVSQRAAGLVLNEKMNIGRREFDALKAILTNCMRTGPAEQNREKVADFYSHLAGRIAHVGMVNRAKGEKLRGIFERIEWG
jgi:RNA-directed DNA polymerase